MLSLHVEAGSEEAAGKKEGKNCRPEILVVKGEGRVDRPRKGDQVPQDFPAHVQRIAPARLSESDQTRLNFICCRAF
jgi:hypothetical protein